MKINEKSVSEQSGALFCLIGNCSAISYKAKPSGGCALVRKEDVAIATALGASVLQAERYF